MDVLQNADIQNFQQKMFLLGSAAILYHLEFLQSHMLHTNASQHYHGHMEREHQQQMIWEW